MVEARSVALLDQVCGHLLDKLEDVLHVLELAIAVLLILLPESDDNASTTLAGNGTAISSGHLSDGRGIVFVSQHVLLATHTDSSLSWLSVSIGGTNSASNFVDFNIFGRAVHLLQWVLVSGQVATFFTGVGPQGAIMSVKRGAVADSGDCVLVGVVVEPVQNLVRVLLPCVLSHRNLIDMVKCLIANKTSLPPLLLA